MKQTSSFRISTALLYTSKPFSQMSSTRNLSAAPGTSSRHNLPQTSANRPATTSGGRNGKGKWHTQPRQRPQNGSVYPAESAQKLQTEQASPLKVSWKSRGDRAPA